MRSNSAALGRARVTAGGSARTPGGRSCPPGGSEAEGTAVDAAAVEGGVVDAGSVADAADVADTDFVAAGAVAAGSLDAAVAVFGRAWPALGASGSAASSGELLIGGNGVHSTTTRLRPAQTSGGSTVSERAESTIPIRPPAPACSAKERRK